MVMPVRQRCPECFNEFMGPDVIGYVCPICEMKSKYLENSNLEKTIQNLKPDEILTFSIDNANYYLQIKLKDTQKEINHFIDLDAIKNAKFDIITNETQKMFRKFRLNE